MTRLKLAATLAVFMPSLAMAAQRVGYTPEPIIDAQLSAEELQKAMENVRIYGEQGEARSRFSTWRLRPLQIEQLGVQQDGAKKVKTLVSLTVEEAAPLAYDKRIGPYKGNVPHNAARFQFNHLEVNLTQGSGKRLWAFVLSRYRPFFKNPNSPVYLSSAVVIVRPNIALSRALALGGNWNSLFAPVIQQIIRVASKVNK